MRNLILAAALVIPSFAYAQQPPAKPAPDVAVSAELAQATIEYLSTRPYREVAVIMSHWLRIAQQTQQAQQPEKKE